MMQKVYFCPEENINHPTVIVQPFIQKIFIKFLFVQSLF